MELLEIQSSIESYRNLIENCSEAQFLHFFEKADFFQIENSEFKDFSKEYLNVHFGIYNDKLLGFVVNVSDDFKEWTDDTEIFLNEFQAFTNDSYNNFLKKYENQNKSDEKTAIDLNEASSRISNWRESKLKWFELNAKSNKLINYFQVPSTDFVNGSSNSFYLGLVNSNQNIDVIVGNPNGLFDVSRPVPPFEPIKF